MQNYNKAIIAVISPLIVTGILAAISPFGIDEGTTVGQFLTIVVTGFLVYLIPNKK